MTIAYAYKKREVTTMNSCSSNIDIIVAHLVLAVRGQAARPRNGNDFTMKYACVVVRYYNIIVAIVIAGTLYIVYYGQTNQCDIVL